MSLSRSCREKRGISCVRPIVVGVLVSVVATLILVCIVSLVFSFIECIAKNAVAPLSIVAVAVGCFLGAYICAMSVGKKGLIFGAIIGAAVFLIIMIIGCFGSDFEFGVIAFIKFVIMVAAGCCGGYLGKNGRCSRKHR